ncbi:2,4-dienoyl-CoA reductase [Klebsiella pneumoniae]|uniref:2,4-dienoyl-CoA reductase n=1 Tax=Klebsiella pneumoniae TaxID=573 RepID=A0A378BN82_KLEPN|nr:2,4-dienoyl-CoA reductase [Klebsiella pneumoniae]
MRSRRSAGQFNIAKQIPGKEEFHETLRYYRTMLDLHGVDLRLNTRVTTDDLLAFDETILATVSPRACRRSTGSIIQKC